MTDERFDSPFIETIKTSLLTPQGAQAQALAQRAEELLRDARRCLEGAYNACPGDLRAVYVPAVLGLDAALKGIRPAVEAFERVAAHEARGELEHRAEARS